MCRSSLLGAVVVLCGCGVGADGASVGTLDEELRVGTKIFEPPDQRDCRVVAVRPAATGTVLSAPTAGMLDVAPVGSSVQSMFFDTSMLGPETRHGVAEFVLPAVPGRLIRATLSFTDAHGWQLQPVPADLHTLTLYGNADGIVTSDDYIREGSPFATFSTDLNDSRPVQRVFDVTGRTQLGGRLGARLELERTPTSGSYGSGFEGFMLELQVCSGSALPNGAPIGSPL